MKLRKVTKGLLSTIMSAVLLMGAVPFGGAGTQVEAGQDKTVSGLSVAGIAAPQAATSSEAGWKGSYVWYGNYEGQPVKYRVLNPNGFEYGVGGLHLDCDSVLFMDTYDKDGEPNNSSVQPNDWAYSDLRGKLHGDYFLKQFTAQEQNALLLCTVDNHDLVQGSLAYNVHSWTQRIFKQFVGVTIDNVFLSDMEELSNSGYGYSADFGNLAARVKKYNGTAVDYVTRSADRENKTSAGVGKIGYVDAKGQLSSGSVQASYGISPAFNVNYCLVLFNSVVKGTSGAIGAEYKLTLNDKNLNVTYNNGAQPQMNDGTVSIQYRVYGSNMANANQISVLILDKEYTTTAGVRDGAKILYYGKMKTAASTVGETGTASFKLPSNLNYNGWNREYYVYMIAEDVNGVHESDYASAPYRIGRPAISTTAPTITTQPQNKTVNAGTTAAFSVRATGEGTLSYQWQSRKNADAEWSNSGQSGAKTANLSVNATAGLDGWQFRCVVRNSNGQTTVSNTVTLTVNPAITTQPKDVEVVAGTVAKFTVAASAKAPITYRWQSRRDSSSSWTNSGQSGARTATLSVNATAGLNGWQFRCIVKDGSGREIISRAATLSVVPMKITTQPKNTSVTVGSVAKFTVAAEGSGTLTYQWQSRRNSSANWAYSSQSGATTNTLSVSTTPGLNGWQFRCIVRDSSGRQVVSNAATLTVSLGVAPTITTQPTNKTVTAGSVAKFTVAATGTGTLEYQWQSRKDSNSAWSNSGQSGARTANLSVATTPGLNGWQFRCVVKDAYGQTAISNVVTVTVR